MWITPKKYSWYSFLLDAENFDCRMTILYVLGDILIFKSLKKKNKKKTSSVYDCTVEDVEYICNSNSTLCLFYFAIFVVLLLS